MPENPVSAALEEIREREQQATPGPWGWFGNTDQHNVYLATRQWGRFIVMGFRRWGTQGARPVFATGRTWKTPPKSDMDFGPAGRMAPASEMFTGKGELTDADELAVFAVAPGAESRKDPRVYRADLSGIRNPDAEFIAGAREDVPRLLATVDAALKFHEPRQLHELAFNPNGTPAAAMTRTVTRTLTTRETTDCGTARACPVTSCAPPAARRVLRSRSRARSTRRFWRH